MEIFNLSGILERIFKHYSRLVEEAKKNSVLGRTNTVISSIFYYRMLNQVFVHLNLQIFPIHRCLNIYVHKTFRLILYIGPHMPKVSFYSIFARDVTAFFFFSMKDLFDLVSILFINSVKVSEIFRSFSQTIMVVKTKTYTTKEV